MNRTTFPRTSCTNDRIRGLPGLGHLDLPDDADGWLHPSRARGSQSPTPVEPLTGTAASEVARRNPVHQITSAASPELVLTDRQPFTVLVHINLPEDKWLRLKWSHFKREGRQARIEASLKALEEGVIRYALDTETMRWIAQEADLEDI